MTAGAPPEHGRLPRLALPLLPVAAFAVSMAVFSRNQCHQGLDEFIGWTGLGVGVDALAIVTFLALLALGLQDRRQLSFLYLLSGLVLLPSLLGLSRVDWFAALGLPMSVAGMANELPEAVIVINGIVVVGGYLLHHSLTRSVEIAESLVKGGADPHQVDIVVNRNLRFLGAMLLLVGAVTVVEWAVASALGPAVQGVAGLVPGLYLWLAVGAGAALAFLSLRAVRRDPKG